MAGKTVSKGDLTRPCGFGVPALGASTAPCGAAGAANISLRNPGSISIPGQLAAPVASAPCASDLFKHRGDWVNISGKWGAARRFQAFQNESAAFPKRQTQKEGRRGPEAAASLDLRR
jgi:hypothetical protein